jgi:hypothetical protein
MEKALGYASGSTPTYDLGGGQIVRRLGHDRTERPESRHAEPGRVLERDRSDRREPGRAQRYAP